MWIETKLEHNLIPNHVRAHVMNKVKQVLRWLILFELVTVCKSRKRRKKKSNSPPYSLILVFKCFHFVPRKCSCNHITNTNMVKISCPKSPVKGLNSTIHRKIVNNFSRWWVAYLRVLLGCSYRFAIFPLTCMWSTVIHWISGQNDSQGEIKKVEIKGEERNLREVIKRASWDTNMFGFLWQHTAFLFEELKLKTQEKERS